MIKLARYRLKTAGLPNYEADAEDVVQNAFLKISKYIGRMRRDTCAGEEKAYVMSVAANEAINAINEYKRFDDIESHEEELSDDSFFDAVVTRETYNAVVEYIKNMDEKYSITLLFYYCEEMSVSEIADMMGVSESTVYSRIRRGKRILLESIKGI
jgi:RNA polymerase sigma-70 factor (ECF subfamily)